MTETNASGQTAPPEILIIGAGLAGLAYALHLQRAGMSVQVLEAVTFPVKRTV